MTKITVAENSSAASQRRARTELLVSTDCDATNRDDKTHPVTKIGIIEQTARVRPSFLQALQILACGRQPLVSDRSQARQQPLNYLDTIVAAQWTSV